MAQEDQKIRWRRKKGHPNEGPYFQEEQSQ